MQNTCQAMVSAKASSTRMVSITGPKNRSQGFGRKIIYYNNNSKVQI